MQARTDADKENRTVVISNIKLTDTRFPSADPASAAKLGELVRAFFKPDDYDDDFSGPFDGRSRGRQSVGAGGEGRQ